MKECNINEITNHQRVRTEIKKNHIKCFLRYCVQSRVNKHFKF